MNVISSNVVSVMALIAAGISTGIKLHKENLLHDTKPEQGQWDYTAVLIGDGVETRDSQEVN